MILYAINLLMAIVWAAITGSASLHNLIFGFVLSTLALGLIREQINGTGYIRRVIRIASLAWLFFVELAKSAWKVAVMVVSPRLDIKPGIFAFPLTVTRDFEITLLANLITLTPGTLSVDVSDDKKTLYVHAIDCADPDAARRDIAEGFERKIREAFA
ncbi:MAG: Na+/H+ antiporter subunit E [Alphaproteobacteria bacterium]|jgi:multicomponent Na+:H+ antiporter subunit E|nr:Na+/H+ antiporter subunit E [Rhizobiaceae bacterium]MBC7148246.1 Na+/H+ antiporter subunit E [Rhizobium sp.]MBU3960000.1 Na+/H+ antiporter subunit E [Alphaproteobacteria bacterium]MBU4050688.1 Na+/H+ antiporter subunit E [Alphaproteobacteria bacterium]MBU4089655.1 Na+/H+ antiporter subunit E [Alphaproteobacteria bacterium]